MTDHTGEYVQAVSGSPDDRPEGFPCLRCGFQTFGGSTVSVKWPSGSTTVESVCDRCAPLYGSLVAGRDRIADLSAERQAVIDCLNLYGNETLHSVLDAIGFAPREASRSASSEAQP